MACLYGTHLKIVKVGISKEMLCFVYHTQMLHTHISLTINKDSLISLWIFIHFYCQFLFLFFPSPFLKPSHEEKKNLVYSQWNLTFLFPIYIFFIPMLGILCKFLCMLILHWIRVGLFIHTSHILFLHVRDFRIFFSILV